MKLDHPCEVCFQACRGRLRNARHADARLGKEQRSNITAQRYSSQVQEPRREDQHSGPRITLRSSVGVVAVRVSSPSEVEALSNHGLNSEQML
jgi:hypothetical protein